MLFKSSDVFIRVCIDAKVDDFEASTFHHHGYKVLTDVMNVAFDGANYNFAD